MKSGCNSRRSAGSPYRGAVKQCSIERLPVRPRRRHYSERISSPRPIGMAEVCFLSPRLEWDLPAGRRFVVVPRDNRPLEFQYVYVPDATQLLRWQVVKNPHAMCDDSNYRVTVLDLNSRRGPTRTESRVFRVSQLERQELASLPMDVFRGQIVTIQLSSLAETSASESCVAWSDLSLVAAPVASASDGPRGEYRR